MLQGLSMTVLRPIVLKKIISLVSSTEEDASSELTLWLGIFIITLTIETMFLTWVQHIFSEQFGTSMIATLGIIVQDKSLRLAPGQGGNETGIALAFTVMMCLTEIALTVLIFLIELVLAVLLFLTDLALTVLIFLTVPALTVLMFLTDLAPY
jgi:hypothetical protein